MNGQISHVDAWAPNAKNCSKGTRCTSQDIMYVYKTKKLFCEEAFHRLTLYVHIPFAGNVAPCYQVLAGCSWPAKWAV